MSTWLRYDSLSKNAHFGIECVAQYHQNTRERLRRKDMYNRYIIMCIVWLHLFVAVASSGQILVRQDRNITGQWEFGNVRSPSAGDFGEKCQVKMISNALYKGSDYLSGLIDGCVADNDKKTRQAVFLTDATGHNGRIVLELGRSIELVEINTYSRHNSKGDQGARGPQVYTLYGTNVEQPGHYLATRGNIWKKIAEVDTRPNSTGVDWSGMYGVSISAAEGAIGPYRYLLWDISSTKSPLVKKDGRSQTFYVEFDVHTKETTGKTKAAKPYSKAIPTNLEEVIIVHKTHFDIGYTDLIDNVIHRYRTSMIDNALSVVNQSKGLPIEQRFVWTVAGWPMMKILEDWPGQTVQRKNAVHDAFKKGYFAVHAYAFTTHTESLDLEDMVRGFRYSSEISRVSGKRLPQAVKMTDVPSHSWILPTIFKNAGVNFLHLGCNAVSQSPSVPEIFMWQGPDGSELLTMYYPIDYGDSSLVPPKKWPYKTWHAMQMTGDNHGPPSPDKVRKLLQRAQAELPGNVKVRLGTLDDFGKAILAENAEIPVVRGDMPDSWIHGIMEGMRGMNQQRSLCSTLERRVSR